MRIEGLELKNIGVFEDVKMEFPKCPDGQAEIHIFTGVNGSGKSTILKALACGFEEVAGKDSSYSKDQNKLYDYFSFEDKGIAHCTIILNSNKEIDVVGLHLIGIEVSTNSQKIKDYRFLLINNKWDYVPMNFAVFAYSGYRVIDNNQPSEIQNENSLYQALKFIKDPNPNHSLEEWVKKSLYKRAYAHLNKLERKEHSGTPLK